MITVGIFINNVCIKTLSAVRVEGDTNQDSVNTYRQLLHDSNGGKLGYTENYIKHRYGDGAEVLAVKMLENWRE